MGPIVIYDKSVLEALNKEESILLQKYFHTNITPVIFLEVLADLKESPRSQQQTAEQRVARLAEKLPILSSIVNAHHDQLSQGELFHGGLQGHHVKMGRVPISSNQPKVIKNATGRQGLIYPESREEKALSAWRKSQFSELDYLLAQEWKDTHKSLDLNSLANELKRDINKAPKFTTIQEVKQFVDEELNKLGEIKPFILLRLMLHHFGASEKQQKATIEEWKKLNRECRRIIKPHELAPYAHYIFSVELFFRLALSQRLIASGKKSKSHIDLQYLYYLPFCMTFISNDNFHKKVVPLFLKEDQLFIEGDELKKDFIKISKHLDTLTEEEKGIRDSGYPPQLENSVICENFDFHAKGWRKKEAKKIRITKEQNDKIMKRIGLSMEEKKEGQPFTGIYKDSEFDFVVKERMMTRQQMKERFDLSEEKLDEIMKAQKKQ